MPLSSDAKHFSPPAKFRRANSLLMLCLSAPLFFGCGGSNSFTGGGIPIGRSVLTGRVVSSENPQSPLVGVTVSVSTDVGTRAPIVMQAVTDGSGNFTISNIPVGAANGTAQITVTPSNTGTASEQFTITLRSQHSATLIAALPQTAYTFTAGTTETLSPANATLTAGGSVRFVGQIHDAANNLLPYTPTLLFDSDFGTLNADGTFTANGVGTANVIAFWYGSLQANSSVVVQPNTGSKDQTGGTSPVSGSTGTSSGTGSSGSTGTGTSSGSGSTTPTTGGTTGSGTPAAGSGTPTGGSPAHTPPVL